MLIGCRRQCFSLLCRVGQTVVSPPPPDPWRISGAKPFGFWPLVRVGRSSCSVGSVGPSVLCVYYVVYFLVCQFQKSKGNSEPPPPLLANSMARTDETRLSFYRKFARRRRRRTLHLFTRKGCTPTAISRAGKIKGGLTKNLDDNHADAKQKINKWHEQFS